MRRTVKRVYDGDTILINRKIQGTNRIRLANVNAPERYTKGGRIAKSVLQNLIGDGKVSIRPVGKSYGRIVANIVKDRTSINKKMRRLGYR